MSISNIVKSNTEDETSLTHIVPGIKEVLSHIRSTVSNRDWSCDILCNVVLEISGNSTNIRWVEHAGLDIVDDLVSGEEHRSVGVVLETLYNRKGSVEVASIIGSPGRASVNTLSGQWGIDIEKQVNANLKLISKHSRQTEGQEPQTALKMEAHSSWFRLGSML